MKINESIGIAYSGIRKNSGETARQNVPKELEKKMGQYKDTLSISRTGQESVRHLSSVNSMNYVNRFEKEVTDIFAKEETNGNDRSDSFEHHVNRMAAAYEKMKNSIDQKYAAEGREPEYYVSETGKIEELTKEKELAMLDMAYKNHSTFMAASTEIWAGLQDFAPSVVYHKGGEQPVSEKKESHTADSGEKGAIRDMAYQAFLSAIQPDNQKLLQQYSGDWKALRFRLDISEGDRKMLNRIWDLSGQEQGDSD